MAETYRTGPVCADMLVAEVLQRFPPTLRVFRDHGLPCPRCLANGYENVSQIAVMLGVDLDRLLDALNRAAAPEAPVAARLPYGREPSAN